MCSFLSYDLSIVLKLFNDRRENFTMSLLVGEVSEASQQISSNIKALPFDFFRTSSAQNPTQKTSRQHFDY